MFNTEDFVDYSVRIKFILETMTSCFYQRFGDEAYNLIKIREIFAMSMNPGHKAITTLFKTVYMLNSSESRASDVND